MGACAWVTSIERGDRAVGAPGAAACNEHTGKASRIAAAQRDRHHRAAMVDWKRDIRLSPPFGRRREQLPAQLQTNEISEKRAPPARAWRRLLIRSARRFALHEVNCSDCAAA